MLSSADKKYKLSIYLKKESYTDDTQIVPECGNRAVRKQVEIMWRS